MSKKMPEQMNCEACGSWEFECRDDGEYYCIACALPVIKKVDESANKQLSAVPDISDAVGNNN